MAKYFCDTVELRKAMAEAGLFKIGDLASKAGVSRNTLGKILKNEELPSSGVMYKLAPALNLSPMRAGEIFFAIDLRNT